MKTISKLGGVVHMERKGTYKTKQMTELLAYLKSRQGSHVTVNDICSYFTRQGIPVGTTTIYRRLERMVEQGEVAKYVVDGTSSACFEYVGTKEQTAAACYHCKCEKCGKLIHLQCHEVEELRQHMMEHHGFEMNSRRTVFYGICSACREKER